MNESREQEPKYHSELREIYQEDDIIKFIKIYIMIKKYNKTLKINTMKW